MRLETYEPGRKLYECFATETRTVGVLGATRETCGGDLNRPDRAGNP